MIRIIRRALVACAVLTAVLAAPGVARADVIGDWNLIAQQQTIPLRPTAHGESRGMAMVEGAVYDAVNAIDGGYQPYLVDPRATGAQPWFSQNAAAATAAHDVLVAIAPGQQTTLDGLYATTMAGINDAFKAQGAAVGAAAAQAMLAFRQNDGFMAAFDWSLVIGPDAGDWRPMTPTALDPDPWVGNLKPFLIERPDQFRSDGPNALTSGAYTEDFNEVKELGSRTSTKRTADETAAAVFWQFPPIALYNGVARSLAVRYGLGTADQARLYAMINLAAADGAISCWNDKYYWDFWRPWNAIARAAEDGNPATAPDPTWTALITAPYPEAPSGHNCLDVGHTRVLQTVFGTDAPTGGFRITSASALLTPADARIRTFTSFSQALTELIEARIWAGLHYRFADVQGQGLGRNVADYTMANSFQRLGTFGGFGG